MVSRSLEFALGSGSHRRLPTRRWLVRTVHTERYGICSPREPITVCLEGYNGGGSGPQSRSCGTCRCGLPASQVTADCHAQPTDGHCSHSRTGRAVGISFAFLSLFPFDHSNLLQATTVWRSTGPLLLLRQPKGSACTMQRSPQLLDTLALSPRFSVYFILLLLTQKSPQKNTIIETVPIKVSKIWPNL